MNDINLKELTSSVVSKQGDDDNKITFGDKLDKIITHRFFGVIIFAIIMLGVFTISQVLTATFTENFITAPLESLNESLAGWLEDNNTNIILSGLITEGLLAGSIAIIGFLPLIAVLFFLLSLLEDSGYMARVSIVMDRIFRRVGLSGRSIIPMYVGTACAVPGVMAARTIKNTKQKRSTILLTPFMPCGAKLPVIALFLGVYFTDAWYASAFIYLLAFAVILFAGFIIKVITNTQFKNAEETFLIVELPDYKLPSLKNALVAMLNRSKDFIIKAATIIVIFNAIVWLAMNFSFSFKFLGEEGIENSILHTITEPFGFLLSPIGISGTMAWAFLAAAIAGLIAKENIIAAIVIIFGLSGAVTNDEVVNSGLIDATLGISAASGIAFLVFNLFIPPCVAAISAMYGELNSKRWIAFAITFQIVIGYVVSIISYQVLSLILDGSFGSGLIAGISILVGFTAVVIILNRLAKQGKALAKI